MFSCPVWVCHVFVFVRSVFLIKCFQMHVNGFCFVLLEGMTKHGCSSGFECLLELEIKLLLLSCSTCYKLHLHERSAGFIMYTLIYWRVVEGGACIT